jgi:acyl-coenzyme A thioesterase PaaI-like protein
LVVYYLNLVSGFSRPLHPIPSGFKILDTKSPFNLHVGPYYYLPRGNEIVFGLLISMKHCNTSGRLHGAMVCAIADIALGHNIVQSLTVNDVFDESARDEVTLTNIVTMNLSTDYSGTALEGDWVEVHVEVQRAGKSMAFANAYLVRDGERIARVSGIYRVYRRVAT